MSLSPSSPPDSPAQPAPSASPRHEPIIIAGGGMVGMTLGLALARAGLSSVIIEAERFETTTAPTFDGRVSAIAASSVRLFQALGVWDELAPKAQPINDILVSDGRPGEAPSPMTLHFDPRELVRGEGVFEPLGHLIENRDMRAVLSRAVSASPQIRVIAPQSVTGIDPGSASTAVHLRDGTILHAGLVIAADGRNSPVRKAAGIKTVGWSYGQTAIVATIAHEAPHHGLAHELFLPSGPFAILPMVGNQSSIVWTEKSDLAPYYLGLNDDDFAAEVARRFGGPWGAVRPTGPRWSYPLGLQLARSYVKPRLALIGDAAHGVHPIAGQGLNLGLRDVAALAEVLIDGARLGRDPGDLYLLKDYERWRRTDNVTLALSMDLLNRLFSTDAAPVRLARDLGLGAVAALGPLKRIFMRHAMGDIGRKPKLLDGIAI